MKKRVTLYNVAFPLWLLWLMPMTWFVVFPVNFFIDLLVIVLTMKYLKIPDIKHNSKVVILRVWLMGFAADLIGSCVMYIIASVDFGGHNQWREGIQDAMLNNPFQSNIALLLMTVGVIVSSFFIYLFNYKWCLEKASFNDMERKKVALSLAVFTAPYLFYLPTEWFYR